MAESQLQHTAAAPATVVGVDTTLLAACQLLNNPPLSGASPLAAEQWRHDVDQLVVAAINTRPQERRCQPSAQYSRTLSVMRAPSVACAQSIARAPLVEPNARPRGVASHTNGELRDGRPQG
jgi:hypothetical protein